ncbi:MAG: hypothetical protein CSA97_03735, partial [Bacteroidetes bacterium]
MAFGFPPKHREEFKHGYGPEEFFALVAETADALNWGQYPATGNRWVILTKTTFLSWGEEVVVDFEEGVARIESHCSGTQMMDWGKNRRNVERFLAKFQELERTLTPEIIAEREAERQKFLNESEEETAAFLAANEKTSLLSLLKPMRGYLVTPLLMYLNVLVFVLMVASGVHFISPDADSLLNWGANWRPSTLDGQPWRLLTSCFLHFGIVHLLMNMYALVYIGRHLEPVIGSVRFLGSYLLAGVAGSLASLWFNEPTVSAGASGAIFGMYGVMLTLLTAGDKPRHLRNDFVSSIVLFIVYNIINGFLPNSG